MARKVAKKPSRSKKRAKKVSKKRKRKISATEHLALSEILWAAANPEKKGKPKLTKLPPGTKITRLPPGRAAGAALPREYVHPSGEYQGQHHPEPAAEWTYRSRNPGPKVRKWIGAGFAGKTDAEIRKLGTWQYNWALTTDKGWRLVIESASGITYWPVQTSNGDIVGFEYHEPKRGEIPKKVLQQAKAIFKKGWKHYQKTGNPMAGVPGGGIAECIEEMSTRPDVDDPGALCAWIARERGEFGWRSLPHIKRGGKKSTARRKELRSVMGKALRNPGEPVVIITEDGKWGEMYEATKAGRARKGAFIVGGSPSNLRQLAARSGQQVVAEGPKSRVGPVTRKRKSNPKPKRKKNPKRVTNVRSLVGRALR